MSYHHLLKSEAIRLIDDIQDKLKTQLSKSDLHEDLRRVLKLWSIGYEITESQVSKATQETMDWEGEPESFITPIWDMDIGGGTETETAEDEKIPWMEYWLDTFEVMIHEKTDGDIKDVLGQTFMINRLLTCLEAPTENKIPRTFEKTALTFVENASYCGECDSECEIPEHQDEDMRRSKSMKGDLETVLSGRQCLSSLTGHETLL